MSSFVLWFCELLVFFKVVLSFEWFLDGFLVVFRWVFSGFLTGFSGF